MAKRKEIKRCPSRIDRIERKCDRILSVLIILSQRLSRTHEIDTAIDKMHRVARNMRMQAERERTLTRRMFHSFPGSDGH